MYYGAKHTSTGYVNSKDGYKLFIKKDKAHSQKK